MKPNAHSRRTEHRATLRKAVAGQLDEAATKAVQTAEATRKANLAKPAVVLNRKQRKNKKAQKRALNK